MTDEPVRVRGPFARIGAAACGALLLAAPAVAETLRIGVGAPATSLDPHFHNNGPNNALTMHLFDRLVERDARARPQPSLAESWTQLSPTLWEFRLRRDATGMMAAPSPPTTCCSASSARRLCRTARAASAPSCA
ncbi:hypothetical protein [Teichococcus aestuarii]|uniref:hypothetical protein n=1 Tax=Teichococcus aestuarii TaxID=568898 RepID=UPI003609562C